MVAVAQTTVTVESSAKGAETLLITDRWKTVKHKIRAKGLKARFSSRKSGYEGLTVVSGTVTLTQKPSNSFDWEGFVPIANAPVVGDNRTHDITGRRIISLWMSAPITNPSDVQFAGVWINPGSTIYMRGLQLYVLTSDVWAWRRGATGPGGSIDFKIVCQ